MKKIILITGASSGIGKTTALDLLKEGHIVYGAARRVDKMQDIVKAGGFSLELDVTKEEQIQNAIKTIISAHGRIDVLINNAGFGMYGAMEDTSLDDARYQFEVNVFGLARVTQLVLPHMRAEKSGRIINVSSMAGKVYMPFGAWYHGTKHCIEGWSDCLRVELKQFGIDVVIIEPGIIETEFDDVMLEPMLQRSGNGPYSDMAHKIAEATKKNYTPGNASPTSVISNLIVKAIKAKRPRTRYAAGKLAKPIMFIRKYFGDRIMDKALKAQMK